MKEVNTSYYQQLLDKGRYNSSDRNFYQKVLDSIKKQGGKATDRQYNITQQIKFGKTMYSLKNEHIYNKNNIMNQTTQLRQLIRESINEYIKAIDEAGHEAGMKARMEATQEAINKRKKMTELAGLDEDVQKMIDERKVKEVNSEVKALEKSLAKLQKQFDKLASKANKGEKVEDVEEKEIVDEAGMDVNLNENEEEFDLELYFQKANKEYGWDFDGTTTVEGDLEYSDESWKRTFAKKLMNIDKLPYNKWKAKANQAYNASQVNESLTPEDEERYDEEENVGNGVRPYDVMLNVVKGYEGLEDYVGLFMKNFPKGKPITKDAWLSWSRTIDGGYDPEGYSEEYWNNPPQLEKNVGKDMYYAMAKRMKDDGKDYDETVKRLEDMGVDDRNAEIIAMNVFKEMEEEMNIYEVLHMQKLAGILSETDYKVKVEEAKKKMTAAQKDKKEDIVKGMKKSKSFGKSKDEKSKMYATATKLATKKKAKSLKEQVKALFEFKVGERIQTPFAGDLKSAVVLAVSSYQDNKEAIDKSIYDSGWESSTPKEELTWYKLKFDNGETMWVDNEELS